MPKAKPKVSKACLSALHTQAVLRADERCVAYRVTTIDFKVTHTCGHVSIERRTGTLMEPPKAPRNAALRPCPDCAASSNV